MRLNFLVLEFTEEISNESHHKERHDKDLPCDPNGDHRRYYGGIVAPVQLSMLVMVHYSLQVNEHINYQLHVTFHHEPEKRPINKVVSDLWRQSFQFLALDRQFVQDDHGSVSDPDQNPKVKSWT